MALFLVKTLEHGHEERPSACRGVRPNEDHLVASNENWKIGDIVLAEVWIEDIQVVQTQKYTVKARVEFICRPNI